MRQIRIFFISIFSFVLLQTNAQTLNFFKDNIYNLNYNPAAEVTVRAHILLPAISNLDVQLHTNIVNSYKSVFSSDNQGNKVIDPKRFFAPIPNSSYGEMAFNLNTELLGFGFKVGEKLYLTFDSRLRSENTFFAPKGLFQLLSDGNIEHINENMSILPLASVLMYTDFSVGAQYKLTEQITIGLRGKLLMGLLGANIKESSLALMTDPEWNLHLKGSALVNLYVPKGLINNKLGNISNLTDLKSLFDFNNFRVNSLFNSWGGGFDVGAEVKLPLNFGVKASLIDVGWIKWNRDQEGAISYKAEINPNHRLCQNGELVFDGISLNSFNLSDTFFSNLLDTFALGTAFLFTKATPESYVMRTNPKLFLEGYYQLKIHKFSALMRIDFLQKGVLPSFTLAYNLNVKRIIDIAASYTLTKGSYGNLGVGFSLNPGNVFHFYVVTDNLLTILFPLANNNFNVQTGMFFTIPAKKVKIEQTQEKEIITTTTRKEKK